MTDIVERLRSADVLIVKSAKDLRSVVAEEAAAEIEKLRVALQSARRDALEEAVSRVTAYSQNETARNIVTIIYALGEKE
jgi:uncharacterized membrane protein YccC